MTASIRIRATTLQDIARLPAVERWSGQLFRSMAPLAWLADEPATSAADHAEMVAAGTSWVAVSDEVPVGFVIAEIVDRELHVWELAVDLEHQRRGLGRRLMQTAIDSARGRRLAAVTLTTFRDVPWNAPFYRHLGFRPLTAGDAGPRLAGVLAGEAARGLDGRCAMRLSLVSDHAATR
ncbi:MAG: GNAT family N-acetyltransferase [Pseudomonadales bacterium]